ncbi:uncharacterized protein LOC144112072 [Amblyomma americanum]
MPFAKFFGRTENEAANIEAVVSTHSTTAGSSFNFKRKIRNVMLIVVAVLAFWKNLDLYSEVISTGISMLMPTGILLILIVALPWLKLLLRIPNWHMRLLAEHIHQQAITDTTAKTDGSGEGNLDHQNDHNDQDDLHDFNDLHDLSSQDRQDDLGDLSDLEDLDFQDDESDQCDQGYLADVDDQDDKEDFDNLLRYHGLLLPIEESDEDGFLEEQDVELHF